MVLKDLPYNLDEVRAIDSYANIKKIIMEIYHDNKMVDMIINTTDDYDSSTNSVIDKGLLENFINISGFGNCDIKDCYFQKEYGEGQIVITIDIDDELYTSLYNKYLDKEN